MRRIALIGLLVLGCAPGTPAPTPEPEPEPTPDPTPRTPPRRGGTGGTATPAGGSGGSSTVGGGGTGGAGGSAAAGAPGGRGGSTVDAAAGAGGTTDAGAVDAAPIVLDASSDAAPTPGVGGPSKPCTHAFCESFEGFADGASPTSSGVWVRESSTLVVGSHAARGQRALHVPLINTGQRFIRTTKPFPALATEHYGRMFLYIAQEPQVKPTGVYHWTAVEVSNRTAGSGYVIRNIGGLAYGPGNNQLFFNIEPHDSLIKETGRGDSRARLPAKVWHCLEWYYNQPKSQARTWWNGTERAMAWPDPANPTDAKYTDPKWFFPEPKAFSVGWAAYQMADQPWDVWIDEVVLHTERVGCDG